MRPFLKKARKYTLIASASFILYGVAGKRLNVSTTKSPGDKLTTVEARQIIRDEQEKFYLDGKVINFIPLNGDHRIPDKNTTMAFAYSSGGEFYIAMNEDEIYRKVLFHEIGHAIASPPIHSESTLESHLGHIIEKGDPKNYSKKRWIKYLYSPEEFFCNLYALIKN